MLYHYFGNKEALWLAVLEHVYAELLAAENALDLANAEPVDGVRRLVVFLWDYYLAHPEFVALVNNENLLRAAHLSRSPRIRHMHSRLVARLEALLARGRARGVFRGDVDAVQLYITCAALAYFYQSNRHTLSTIFGRDLMSPRAQAQRLSHATAVVLGYLAPV
jgi:AcrR family transcriptional regulator